MEHRDLLPEIPLYFPQFLWKFWLTNFGHERSPLHESRLNIYDVFNNELSELHHPPKHTRPVFQDFDTGILDDGCLSAIATAQEAFSRLECEAEAALAILVQRSSMFGDNSKRRRGIPMEQRAVNVLRNFFIFLRYRNSERYRTTVLALRETNHQEEHDGVFTAYRPFFHRVRRRIILGAILAFLQHPSDPRPSNAESYQEVQQYCWRLCDSELCIGMASEDQEFILTDSCFGSLDEGFQEDPDCCDIFFPVSPTLSLYLLADGLGKPNYCSRDDSATVWLDCGIESPSDIHLRNAMLLQTCPGRLYFSSLRSISLSIASYDEFRWIPEHLDYSRLKQRCRQKYTQECVTKTLVIKGSVMITDLTDHVVKVGQSPAALGSFSDVWKGLWTDPVLQEPRMVALKCLRQIMVQNVKEKLLKRLKDEVVAWHRLQHPNIAQLHGIIQYSDTIAMVSPWCENGTICRYLREVNPAADRLKLIIEVASGVSYLHNCKIIHGDLKGGNILIDEHGRAIITDFGLSKVMEEISDSINPGTSFFAGSTRYMAPELVLALVEDNDQPPPITTFSDVYAFACVCLEIATGQLPYSHRTNDHAVTVDIMRGVKPSRGITSCHVRAKDVDSFWTMLERCWNVAFTLRPSMSDMETFLRSLVDYASCCR